jgi:hypothetical protein
MSSNARVKKFEGLTGGLVLMVIGTLFLLDRVDILGIRSIWTWWPLIPIAMGTARLAGAEDHGQRRSAVWLLLVGGWALLNVHGWYGLHWGNSWPLLLIALGGLTIWQALADRESRPAEDNGGAATQVEGNANDR